MQKYKIALLAMAFLISNSSISIFAQEARVFEAAPILSEKNPAANTLTFTITEKGQILPRPGELFSQGRHEGELMPYLISTPKPIPYPRWAVRQGWEGDFSIAIEVLTDGTVGRYQIMKSTGHAILDEAATTSVKSWKFQPAMKNGKPLVTCIQIPIRFQLDTQTT